MFKVTCLYLTFGSISQHRYSAAFCSGGDFQLTSFMSKTAIRGNITVFSADIAATRAKGLTYVLGYELFIFILTVLALTTVLERPTALPAMELLVSATLLALRSGPSTTLSRLQLEVSPSSISTKESVSSTTLSVYSFLLIAKVSNFHPVPTRHS